MNARGTLNRAILSALLFILPACSHFSDRAFNEVPDNFTPLPAYTFTQGSYGDYGNPRNLRYYKNVLSPDKWRENPVLNYNSGYFAFPPLCGYRVLHYEDVNEQTKINLFRDVIGQGEDLDALIARKMGCDHCKLMGSFPRSALDMELVEADSSCYVWLYGDYRGKYYFLKTGNVVYTFSMFCPPDTYSENAVHFNSFVRTTINRYLVYSPRNQDIAVPTQHVEPSQKDRLSPCFTRKELISFFSPNQNLTFK